MPMQNPPFLRGILRLRCDPLRMTVTSESEHAERRRYNYALTAGLYPL